MKKLFLLPLLLLLAFITFIPKSAEAKVWTKELVDKVILDSGYKFSLCTIDMKYDRSNSADNIFSVQEKDFEGNPNNYPCNKQSQEDILFANITLYFNQANGGGKMQDKMVQFQNKLYSINSYGGVYNSDLADASKYADIAAFDWFSTLEGVHGIRVGELYNTDPNAKGEFLPNSPFLIIHDPITGKFVSALFMFNNVTYKLSNIISQVTVETTLVDYSQSQPQPTMTTKPFPTASSTTIGQETGWSIYTNNTYHFSFKYPSTLKLNSQDNDKAVFDGIKEQSIPSQLIVNFTPTINLNSILNCTKINPSNEGNKVLCIEGNPTQKSVGSTVFDVFTLKVDYKGLVDVYQVAQTVGNPKIEFVNKITNSNQILDQILPMFIFTTQ